MLPRCPQNGGSYICLFSFHLLAFGPALLSHLAFRHLLMLFAHELFLISEYSGGFVRSSSSSSAKKFSGSRTSQSGVIGSGIGQNEEDLSMAAEGLDELELLSD